MTTTSRTVALLLGLALIAPAGPAAAQAPDIQAMLDTSLEMMRGVDRDEWAQHAFKRQVTRQSLDETGDVESLQVMLFQVTPTGDGFDDPPDGFM